MRYFVYLCLLVSVALPVHCLAQTKQSADEATNADSPKAAIKSLVVAMSTGDAHAMRELLYADTPTNQKLVTAMTDTAVAIAELNRGMNAKFGAEQTKAVMGDPADAVKVTTDGLERAQEIINGDNASVSMAHTAQGTMSLKKVDGKWKVDVAAYLHGTTPEQVNQTLTGVNHGITVFKDMLADVNAGKFKTAREAGEAMRSKMTPPPTTLPTK